MKSTPYFDTLTEAVNSLQVALDDSKAELLFSGPTTPADDHWTQDIFKTGHLGYGETRSFNFEIKTIKDKPTRKWFHATFYRMDSGRYEVTSYIL